MALERVSTWRAVLLCLCGFSAPAIAQDAPDAGGLAYHYGALLDQYCVLCHNSGVEIGEVALDRVDLAAVADHAHILEEVVTRIRGGSMPPSGLPRPDPGSYHGFVEWLEAELDRAAAQNPDPGRPALYRLNRTQYASVIRDLLALDIDVSALLPPDTSSFGFDNIADVLGVSPTLLESYLAAADRVSAVAVGDPEFAPEETYYNAGARLSQDRHIDGLPPGTRGGILVEHYFPLDGIYEIRTSFRGNSLSATRGLQFRHQFELSVDGERVRFVSIGGPADYNHMMENAEASRISIENRVRLRIPLTAGTHRIAATFVEKTGALEVDQLEPFELIDFDPVYVGGVPSVEGVMIRGPFNGQAPSVETPSRRAIFTCRPDSAREEARCAEQILSRLARRAYRQPLLDSDVDALMEFFRQGREARGNFEGGIQLALRRILTSPNFIFRIERDPLGIEPGEPYEIGDLELASRLSFFLWNSVPDEELIDLGARGRLGNPRVMEQQVRRMLADPRADEFVENFAGQWLYLRRLASVEPDIYVFPNFDDNLRQAFLEETQLFFSSIMREDRSVLDLMTANYTYLNDRLARHYGVDGVYGNAFRRVELPEGPRNGLLGHGSILTVTSFSHRTSPVVRGAWILENLLGAPIPMPPDDVPALDENEALSMDPESMRVRLQRHRDDPACSGCHNIMDPIGFAMENFDGIGAWRDRGDDGGLIDASGRLIDGTEIDGADGLRDAIVSNPSQFVRTLTEKLMTYALGRGLEYYDMPSVRQIAADAAGNDYRFSTLILGIVESRPFRMRRAAIPQELLTGADG